jgi:methylamine dehydrogenase light chain
MKLTALFEQTLRTLDRAIGSGSRQLARSASRRNLLTRVGTLLTGAAVLPLLPVARALAADQVDELGDPQSCDYWRYCALGGSLCSCCGGCCGKSLCDRCWCHNTERERPVYFPSKSSAVLWCFGTESRAYHCTIGVVLGEAGPQG